MADAMNSFWIKIILLLPLLVGCGGFVYHKVELGDTLSHIGAKYGKNYKDIARWNNIAAPYVLREGERIRLTPPASGLFSDASQTIVKAKVAPPVSSVATSVVKKIKVVEPRKPSVKHEKILPKPQKHSVLPKDKSIKFTGWSWPTKGRVTKYFSFQNEKKGIEISGRVGQPVRATAAGRVIYSGSGLDKYYKNLIVIEHENNFLSTYGHNKSRLVKEGDYVAGGESVAEMGTSSTGGALLYFEIRKNGKPVNPLNYLSKKQ